MVIFLGKNGEIKFEDIGHENLHFILVLLEGNKYAIIAASFVNYHRDCLSLLAKYRSDLCVISTKGADKKDGIGAEGGGSLLNFPSSRSGLPQNHIDFGNKSGQFGEADPDIVRQLLREAFPEAVVRHDSE